MAKKTLALEWLLVSVLALGLLTGCGGSAQQASLTPSATLNETALLQERCSVCHSLDRVQQARKTAEQWEQTVTRMIGKGAQLSDEERAALLAYLVATYGP